MEELILKAQKGDKEAFTEIILAFENDLYKNFQKNFAIRELPLPDGICGDLSTVKIADIIPFKGKIEHLASFERLRVALVGGRPLFL